MPGKAKSEARKKMEVRKVKHKAKKQAVAAYQNEKAEGGKRGARQFETSLGPSSRTIQRQAKGGRAIEDFNKSKRALLEAENDVLVEHILQLSASGFPPSHKEIVAMANEIIKARDPSFPGVGKNWSGRFLTRNADDLQSYWSSPLDRNRANNMNPVTVAEFFEAYKTTIDTYGIPEENRYAFDETNIQPGVAQKRRVIGGRGRKTQHAVRDGNKTSMTFVPVICGDGSTLKPLCIMRGQRWCPDWGKHNPLGASIALSPKGYIDGDIALRLIKDFDKQTKDKNNLPRLLIVDGHASHCTLPFLRYAKQHNIHVISYHPHTTHEMQALDVLLFALFKRYWAEERDRLEKESGIPITQRNFLEHVAPVYERTFTRPHVKTAWKVVGLIPFDPSVITPDRMAPSTATSLTLSAPSTLASPYRAIYEAAEPRRARAAQGTDEHTEGTGGDVQMEDEGGYQAEDEGGYQAEDEVVVGGASVQTQIRTPRTPTAPRLPNPFLATNDPSSPTRLRDRVIESLQRTSAALLVAEDTPFASDTPFPALQLDPLPLPSGQTLLNLQETHVDELAKDIETLRASLKTAEERAHRVQAQLVLMAMYARRLKQQLYTKENEPKKTKHQLLSKKFARYLTGDEFMAALEEEEEARAAEGAETERKKLNSQRRKELATFRDNRKKMFGAQKEARTEEWKAICDAWTGKKKDMPKLKDMPPIPWPPTPEHLKASAEIIPDDDMEDRDDFGSDMEMIDGEELT